MAQGCPPHCGGSAGRGWAEEQLLRVAARATWGPWPLLTAQPQRQEPAVEKPGTWLGVSGRLPAWHRALAALVLIDHFPTPQQLLEEPGGFPSTAGSWRRGSAKNNWKYCAPALARAACGAAGA